MKEPDKNVLYISDYRMHVTSLMAVALFVYINHKYFTGFFRVFQPPIPIAIDSVTAIGIIAVTDGMPFAHIIALSRTYIVSTKGITVIFLGIFRHLYPWEKFKVIDVCPGFDECEGGIFMLMVCSTIPIRTVAGGALQLEMAIYRWPHILFFSMLSLEERMYFDRLRRGDEASCSEDSDDC